MRLCYFDGIFHFFLLDSLFFEFVHEFAYDFLAQFVGCKLLDNLIEGLLKLLITTGYAGVEFPLLSIIQDVIRDFWAVELPFHRSNHF